MYVYLTTDHRSVSSPGEGIYEIFKTDIKMNMTDVNAQIYKFS